MRPPDHPRAIFQLLLIENLLKVNSIYAQLLSQIVCPIAPQFEAAGGIPTHTSTDQLEQLMEAIHMQTTATKISHQMRRLCQIPAN